MSIRFESTVDHPVDEVFAWHTRPGAMRRLVPPWQPMTVVTETASLADGRAVLGLPAGLRWVADHDPAGYDPPHRFVDRLSSAGPRSWPPRLVHHWTHTHEFAAVPGGTRVRDHVHTPLPAAALRSTFVYRHRQLADDLAAHRDAAQAGLKPLVVAVTGTAGPVGPALSAFLSTGGHRVVRRPDEAQAVIRTDEGTVQIGSRTVTVRTGLVLSAHDGVRRLKRLRGRRPPAWIGLDDLLDVYLRALYDERLTGAIDAVAPECGGRLSELGHRFRRPSLADALAHELGDG
ncbi:TIGR01777 family protein [Mycolicibacterium phlei]|uniref:hypothetical protein n=1 Tax=Mycolicibacterium phlei TaxID=1771 RepID=UPI000776C5B2|nr:hypothetical protein [Mycolicibacterium phlei]KXW62604.1 hypothetical protein MPHL43070_06515 [Mycolicibacterium phlei DSM 43070]KXW70133.1 hypothetical protein MPHL43072_19965 [Mycolicibacterium phlei DSM 43072]KXW76746.1 hypothetical protein JL15_15125 [Mycolicibacterium phlei DSM 43071]STZ19934.1 TIGR01777 family protein [Mycolicibacterium phlei]